MVDDTRRAIIVTGLSALGVGTASRNGSVTGGASIDAGEIEVSDLELVDTDNNSLVGRDVLADETIVAKGVATNVGDVEEIFEIWLSLELDGAWTDLNSKEFDIKAKEAKQVELSADLSSELSISQDYPSTPVYLGGAEIGTIDLLQSGPNIQITGAWLIDADGNRVESLTVPEGDPITAEADLTNDGNQSGEQVLELTYGGNTLDSATVTVDPGQSVTQQLVGDAPQVDSDQEFTINVENQRAGDVTVEDVPDIPESVVQQFDPATFTTGNSTWIDDVGSNDMSVFGDLQSGTLSTGDPSVVADGVDDYGTATPPISGAGLSNFAIEFAIQHTTTKLKEIISGRNSGDAQFVSVWLNYTTISGDGNTQQDAGNILIRIDDQNNNRYAISPDTNPGLNDGQRHTVVSNFIDPANENLQLIIDGEKITNVNTTKFGTSEAPSSFGAWDTPMGYFCRNDGGTQKEFYEGALGMIRWHDKDINSPTI